MAVQLVRDEGPAQQRGTELWEEIDQAKHHSKDIAALQKELSKKSGIEVMASRVLRIGHPVSADESHAMRRSSKKHGRSVLRVDTVQCIQLVRSGELFYLLIPYAGGDALAHEFASVFDGAIPTCLYYELEGAKQHVRGHWFGTQGGEADPIAQLARASSKSIVNGIEWMNSVTGGSQIIKWGLQALPSDGKTVHLMSTGVRGVFSKRFAAHWYLERRDAFVSFAAQLPPSAPPAPNMRHQPIARLFIHEIFKRCVPQ